MRFTVALHYYILIRLIRLMNLVFQYLDWVRPKNPKVLSMSSYDTLVIGSGPGGYVAAIRSSQLGMRTAIIERSALGGVCLNTGCIPSKALLRNAEVLTLIHNAAEFGIEITEVVANYSSAVTRSRSIVSKLVNGVGSLLKKNQVTVIKGTATIVDPTSVMVNNEIITATNIIIATGAHPRSLPGLDFDGELVVSHREAIIRTSLPTNPVIVGGGAIGVEFASIYNAYGSEVTIVEFEPSIMPREDREITKHLSSALTRQGITILTRSRVTEIKHTKTGGKVLLETPDGERSLDADQVLIAVGIEANTENIGLENVGVILEQGFIKVDEHLQTSVPSIFAIGDVTGILPLAHTAQAQGVFLAERLAGEETYSLDYDSMPRALYSNPQVASFGITEEIAKSKNLNTKIGRFPFAANGKALALNEPLGMAKMIIDAKSGEILGGSLIGHDVTEMLGELSLARIMEGTSMEVGAVVNAHPTLSEAVKEAILAAEGRAIHI
jgi:dihydrolipoamide dehydrogenase